MTEQPSTATPPALEAVRARRDDVRVALADLERALAAPAAGAQRAAWATRVEQAAIALRDAFAAHIAVTEDAGGLFADVMERSPRLAHRIDELREDHVALRRRLEQYATRAQSVTEPAVDPLREQGIALLGAVMRHRHLGSELVYEAYLVDVEAGD